MCVHLELSSQEHIVSDYWIYCVHSWVVHLIQIFSCTCIAFEKIVLLVCNVCYLVSDSITLFSILQELGIQMSWAFEPTKFECDVQLEFEHCTCVRSGIWRHQLIHHHKKCVFQKTQGSKAPITLFCVWYYIIEQGPTSLLLVPIWYYFDFLQRFSAFFLLIFGLQIRLTKCFPTTNIWPTRQHTEPPLC